MTDATTAHREATELVGLYRSGELTPVEVAEAALARIDATDADVNAFCFVDGDAALADARASEERYADGEPAGLLDGVPVGLKDVFLARGWPTLKGSATVDEAGPWEDDAPVTAALRRHGAVLLGKTTTPEIGWKAVTDSPPHGVTRNPWDLDTTPGGSSGGTAAAIALGIMPLAPGTDGGGSIRIPGSFCGLVGLKPTFGTVPFWPPSAFGTLAHTGPLSRTVTDTALLLDAIAAPDPRDPNALPAPERSFRDGLDDGIPGLRIAYSPDLGYLDVDPQVRAASDAAARVFAEDLGAEVEQTHPGVDDPHDIWATLWYAGAANALRDLDEEQRGRLDPGLAAIVEEGEGYSALDYLLAEKRRGGFGVTLGRFHTTYDLLLTPTVAVPPFAAGRDVPEGWGDERWSTWAGFSLPFNLTGQPAVTVPCGFTDDGLPIGLQVAGWKHADRLVLRAARAYERANPLHDRRPPEQGAGA